MEIGGHIMANPRVNPRELCHPPMMVEVDHALVVRLRPEAARRDLPVRSLIRDLLDRIATDGLTAAVLDADTVPDD
jgi:hypothetical protein